MKTKPEPLPGAVPAQERLLLIDALRGAALFGVLLVNMLWFAGEEHAVTTEQFALLPTAELDHVVSMAIDYLVFAKAIGIFAFLFGVGFALQLERLGARVVDPLRIYRRRLTGLLAIGLVHWCAVWSGEILHVYAIAGFLLLLVYRARTAVLVVAGILLAILARPLLTRLDVILGIAIPTGDDIPFSERLQVFLTGSFADVITLQFRDDVLPDFVNGGLLAAVVHALGRFMLGVAVVRGGYLQEPQRYRRAFAGIAVIGILLGMELQRDWLVTDTLQAAGWLADPAQIALVGHVTNSTGVFCMTAGYIAAFVLLWQVTVFRHILSVFAPVGQMALTNYLTQSVINYGLFFGFGLALLGRAGSAACLALATVVFAGQTLVSRWWLGRYRFGPFEWLWRWSTYGQRPHLRRQTS